MDGLHKKEDNYYMFASIGSCCAGLESTYTTVVGRADNLFGPYLDKQGRTMMNNNHEILIEKNHKFVGTGHNSEIVQDDEGQDWVFYHAVLVSNPKGRVLMMDQVRWQNGWPYIEEGTPSQEARKPIFN